MGQQPAADSLIVEGFARTSFICRQAMSRYKTTTERSYITLSRSEEREE